VENNFSSEIKLLINYLEFCERVDSSDTISFKMTLDIALSILSYTDRARQNSVAASGGLRKL
jgi:hypothetical protein